MGTKNKVVSQIRVEIFTQNMDGWYALCSVINKKRRKVFYEQCEIACAKKELSESDLIHLCDVYISDRPIPAELKAEMKKFPLLTSLLEKDVARREEKQRYLDNLPDGY